MAATSAIGSTALATLPAAVRWLGAVLFVVAVPAFLITTNVLQIARDLSFYERGFARYGVATQTGLSSAQLRQVAEAFIDYFDGRRDNLDVQVELAGGRRALFNQRELAHMEDVRRLMSGVGWIQLAAGVTLAGVALLGLALWGSAFTSQLGLQAMAGGGLTVGLLVVVAALLLLDFGELFVRFHQLSFSNDLWMLDPSKDYLIMLFPEGFWFDATIRIALLTGIEALAAGALGLGLRIWGARI